MDSEMEKDTCIKMPNENKNEENVNDKADKLIKLAMNAFFEGHTDAAENMLIITQNMYPSEYVTELLSTIRDAKQTNNSSKNTTDTKKEMTKESQVADNVFTMRAEMLLMQLDTVTELSTTPKETSTVNWRRPPKNSEMRIKYLKNKIEQRIDEAQTFFGLGNQEEAEKCLVVAENMYAKMFNEQINAIKGTKREYIQKLTKKGYKSEIDDCLTSALTAFSNGNYETAERFLQRAERMNPSTVTREMTSEIRSTMTAKDNFRYIPKSSDAKNSDINVDNKKEEAERCINTARNAYFKGIELAERLLLKAELLNPSPHAKTLLTEVRAAKASSEQMKKFKSDKCINIAQKAFTAGNVEKANRFLQKAEMIYCDKSEDTDHITKSCTENEIKQKSKQEHVTSDMTLEDKKNKAYIYTEIAEKAMTKGNIKAAEIFLSKAVSLYPSARTEVLLVQVQNKKMANDNSEEPTTKVNTGDVPKRKIIRTKMQSPSSMDTFRSSKVPEHNVMSSQIKKPDFKIGWRSGKNGTKKLDSGENNTGNRNWRECTQQNSKQNSFEAKHEQGEMYFKKAQYAFSAGDLKEAEEILLGIDYVYWITSANMASMQNLLIEIRAAKSSRHAEEAPKSEPQSENVFKDTNKDEANVCIEKAKVAWSDKDFEKAERLLNKAYRMWASEHINIILAEVRDDKIKFEQNSTTESKDKKPFIDINKDEADKCLSLAKTAFANDNFEKAERMLLKAERMCPSEQIQTLMKQVLAAKSSKDTSKYTFLKTESKYQEIDQVYIKLCISSALDALLFAENFDEVERLLIKAIRMWPNEELKDFLEEVQTVHKYNCETFKKTSSLFNKQDVLLAKNAFVAGNFEEVEQIQIITNVIPPGLHNKAILMLDRVGKALAKLEDPYRTGNRNKNTTISKRTPGNVINEEPMQKEPTEDQLRAIRLVNEAQDDYEILGLPKTATLEDIKKASRRMTRLLHPDRNRGLGAEKAYMIFKEAVVRLTYSKSGASSK